MKKGFMIGIAVVLALLIAGIWVVKNTRGKEAVLPSAKVYPMTVSTMRPVFGDVSLTLPYLGVVQNDEDVVVASKISARIEFLKHSGANVSKGAVVVKLDNMSIESGIQSVKSQISSATIALKNFQATHKRTLDLIAVKGASIEQSEIEESKIADAESRIESLTQSLNDISNNSSYATITAPASGIISKTMLNIGDMAMPGQPISIISSQSGSYLKLSVPKELKVYGVVVNGKNCDAVPLNSTLNGLTEYKVVAGTIGLFTGERVEIEVEVYKGKGIKLPFDAVLNRNGKSYVFVKDGEKAIPKEIDIIQSGEDGVAVSGNELEGKELVVEKQDVLLKLLTGVTIKGKAE